MGFEDESKHHLEITKLACLDCFHTTYLDRLVWRYHLKKYPHHGSAWELWTVVQQPVNLYAISYQRALSTLDRCRKSSYSNTTQVTLSQYMLSEYTYIYALSNLHGLTVPSWTAEFSLYNCIVKCCKISKVFLSQRSCLYFIIQNVSKGYLLSNLGCASTYLICT